MRWYAVEGGVTPPLRLGAFDGDGQAPMGRTTVKTAFRVGIVVLGAAAITAGGLVGGWIMDHSFHPPGCGGGPLPFLTAGVSDLMVMPPNKRTDRARRRRVKAKAARKVQRNRDG
jgi:hypothetical protein